MATLRVRAERGRLRRGVRQAFEARYQCSGPSIWAHSARLRVAAGGRRSAILRGARTRPVRGCGDLLLRQEDGGCVCLCHLWFSVLGKKRLAFEEAAGRFYCLCVSSPSAELLAEGGAAGDVYGSRSSGRPLLPLEPAWLVSAPPSPPRLPAWLCRPHVAGPRRAGGARTVVAGTQSRCEHMGLTTLLGS